MNEKMRKKVNAANQEIKKVFEWFESHQKQLDYTDLKLHDVSWFCYKDMESEFPLCYADASENNTDYFYRFCVVSYDQMVEELKQDGIEYKVYHIGRTSSFYTHDGRIISWDRRGYGIDFESTIPDALENIYGGYGIPDIVFEATKEPMIRTDNIDDDDFCEYEDCIDYIASGDFLKDIENEFSDALRIREYIDDFKQNQVEYFKEYIQMYEDDLQAEADKEAAEESKRIEALTMFSPVQAEIFDRYKISADDLEALAEDREIVAIA